LVSHPKQVKHSPKRGFIFTVSHFVSDGTIKGIVAVFIIVAYKETSETRWRSPWFCTLYASSWPLIRSGKTFPLYSSISRQRDLMLQDLQVAYNIPRSECGARGLTLARNTPQHNSPVAPARLSNYIFFNKEKFHVSSTFCGSLNVLTCPSRKKGEKTSQSFMT